jgi:hypothetical protein
VAAIPADDVHGTAFEGQHDGLFQHPCGSPCTFLTLAKLFVFHGITSYEFVSSAGYPGRSVRAGYR